MAFVLLEREKHTCVVNALHFSSKHELQDCYLRLYAFSLKTKYQGNLLPRAKLLSLRSYGAFGNHSPRDCGAEK